MNETERQAEIEKIERELQILQRRYANLDRAGERMRIMTYALPLAFIGAVILALLSVDLLWGSLVALVLLLIGLAFWRAWLVWMRRWSSQSVRWIDHAGWFPGHGYLVPYWADWFAVKRSEAMAVEDMVAERMERLARLRGNC